MENQQNNQNYKSNINLDVSQKTKNRANTSLIVSTVIFIIGMPILFFGSIFSLSANLIVGVAIFGFITLVSLIVSWITYAKAQYKITFYFLIPSFILDALVIGLLIFLVASNVWFGVEGFFNDPYKDTTQTIYPI